MYISQLRLINVRQFEERSFQFRPGFNLLVGENGAGKTTLLRALQAALGCAGQAVRKPGLADEDIRLNTRKLKISADVVNANGRPPITITYSRKWGERAQRDRRANDLLVLFYDSNESVCSSFVGKRIRKFTQRSEPDTSRAEAWLHEVERSEVTARGHALARNFGRSRIVRKFVGKVLSKFSPKFSDFVWRFDPYSCAIRSDDRARTLPNLVNATLRHLSDVIMRHIQEVNPSIVWPDRSIIEIDSKGFLVGDIGGRRQVIPPFHELLKDTDLDDMAIPVVDSSTAELRLTPRILVRSGNGSFFLSQLSDGEKRLFSLFVDIARQLSLRSDADRYDADSAIVLIDEVDVHLHPKWQRMVVPALEDLFPACQFIATTHSPFVIQAVVPGKLQRLDGRKPDPEDYAGRPIEDIVEFVQGVKMPQRGIRAEALSNAAEKYFSLLRQGRRAPAAELHEAEREYRTASEPFSDDPALDALLRLQVMASRVP